VEEIWSLVDLVEVAGWLDGPELKAKEPGDELEVQLRGAGKGDPASESHKVQPAQ
jgi:hypothetical protein